MKNKKDRFSNLPSQHYYHPFRDYEDHRVRLPLSAKLLSALILLLILAGYASHVATLPIDFVIDFKWYLLAFGIIYFLLCRIGIL
ncbi:MAG: hypothetical protein OXG60_12630 [Chloroflexi bacterium]|nr:hypothetical protein [Chloroflexota bacterium]